jgi:hypothetical protein
MSGSNQALSFAWPPYPLDKIFFKESGSVVRAQSASPAAPTFTTVSITNPQNELFFIEMQVSTDGIVWYDSGLEPYYNSAGIYKRFGGFWSMTSSTITVKLFANDAAYTLYYRLVGFSKD